MPVLHSTVLALHLVHSVSSRKLCPFQQRAAVKVFAGPRAGLRNKYSECREIIRLAEGSAMLQEMLATRQNGRGHCVSLAFFSTALDEFAALGVQVLQVSCIVAEVPVAVTANGCDCISAPQQSEFGNSKARSRTRRSSRSISRSPFWWTAALLFQDSTVPAGVRVERVKANLDMICVGKFGGMISCNQMPQESARRSTP